MADFKVSEVDNHDHGIHVLYYQLGTGIIGKYGIDGEAALRRAIRRFASVRGKHVRGLHEACGMKINLKNFYYYGTNPYEYAYRREKLEKVFQNARRHAACGRRCQLCH